ncbi:MAG: BCD family MFS transporter [Caldilineaceae bacterium]|nr:BCD family MFS transporter [Caldilineaceae bacterium]
MNWRRVLQLALVHVGVSITVVPVTSTLNRVMIADMGMSALWVSILVSAPYLLSPLQVWVGNWADRYPIGGRHRSPWIVLGGLMASFGSYLTAHAVYMLDAHVGWGVIAALGSFTLWGVGVNVASVSYLSLLSDLTHDAPGWRSRTVSLMWTAMILSTIATALGIAALLEPFSEQALYNAFGLVWMIASVLVLVGAGGLEPAATGRGARHSADHPLDAYRALAGNPSARRFFVYLLLVLLSIHAQDVMLEPYGADVLGMPVAQTTRLTSIWGVGVFMTLLGGLPVVRRFGKKRSANWGAAVVIAAFGGIIAAGLTGLPTAFMAAVWVLGLGGGLMTVSNLSFMIDMTVPEAAGLYMGAWGVANFAGQALGNIISGLVRDVVLRLTQAPAAGYIAVFGIEIAGLIAAVWLFRRISVEEFQRDAQVQLHEVLALASD